MGKINSRNKGAAGEREFINLLKELTDDSTIRRNLEQSRSGGYDILGDSIGHLAIEIKRVKQLLTAHWEQTLRQADESCKIPVLAYRLDRQQWKVRIHLHNLVNIDKTHLTVDMELDAFAILLKNNYIKC